MKKFRVIYHIWDKVDIKTKVEAGFVVFDNDEIKLISKTGSNIVNIVDIYRIYLFMMYGLGSMLKIEIDSVTVFLSVVRFCVAGQFAMGNAMGTRKLKALLESYIDA
jgi:hypothetical protein